MGIVMFLGFYDKRARELIKRGYGKRKFIKEMHKFRKLVLVANDFKYLKQDYLKYKNGKADKMPLLDAYKRDIENLKRLGE